MTTVHQRERTGTGRADLSVQQAGISTTSQQAFCIDARLRWELVFSSLWFGIKRFDGALASPHSHVGGGGGGGGGEKETERGRVERKEGGSEKRPPTPTPTP